MKPFMTFVLFLSCSFAFGQSIAFTNDVFRNDDHLLLSDSSYLPAHRPHKHCGATVNGEICMAGGSVMMLTGALLTKPVQTNRPTSQGVGPAVLLVGGVIIFIEGALFFVGGEIYDHVHKNRLTIIGKQNQLGLAYNF